MRTVILLVILVFLVVFAALTLTVIAKHGVDILTVLSLAIIAMLGTGVVGALRTPPDR